MKRTISNVLKLRAAFQILMSACVHIHDQDARDLMGDLLIGILAEIRQEQPKYGIMQVWDVRRLPIDDRWNTHWDPLAPAPVSDSDEGKEK